MISQSGKRGPFRAVIAALVAAVVKGAVNRRLHPKRKLPAQTGSDIMAAAIGNADSAEPNLSLFTVCKTGALLQARERVLDSG